VVAVAIVPELSLMRGITEGLCEAVDIDVDISIRGCTRYIPSMRLCRRGWTGGSVTTLYHGHRGCGGF